MNGSVYKRCPCTEARGGTKKQKTCKKNHGSWYYTHDLPAFEGGQRSRIKRGGYPTKDAAEDALAQSLARCAQRGVAAERDMTGRRQLLGDYLKAWLDGKPDIKPATRFSYADHISRFLIPHLGHLRLEDLAVSHIASMYAELRRPKPRPRKPKAKKAAATATPARNKNGRTAYSRGELRAAALAYLESHPAETFTTRQIAIALGTWAPPTRKAMARLVDLGAAELVSKDPCRYRAVTADLRSGSTAVVPAAPSEPDERMARLSPASIQRVHATLRAALNDAVRQRLLDFNPAQLVKLEPVPRPETMYWTGQEAGAFLDAIVEDPLYALYHLAVYRGLRRGEILALRWEDLDLDGAVVSISRNLVVVGGKLIDGTPKSEFSTRAPWHWTRRRSWCCAPIVRGSDAMLPGWARHTRITGWSSPERTGHCCTRSSSLATWTCSSGAPGPGGCIFTNSAIPPRPSCSRQARTSSTCLTCSAIRTSASRRRFTPR